MHYADKGGLIMNNYAKSKKKLDEIRNRDEMLFRMAVSHLMDVGIRHLTDENITETCVEIMKEDDTHSFMTNRYKCALVKTAGELAKIDHIHLLNYISKEVHYDVGDNKISYQRAIKLLTTCMESIYENHSEDCYYTLEDLRCCDFSNDEIEELGYGYLLDVEEMEEN